MIDWGIGKKKRPFSNLPRFFVSRPQKGDRILREASEMEASSIATLIYHNYIIDRKVLQESNRFLKAKGVGVTMMCDK